MTVNINPLSHPVPCGFLVLCSYTCSFSLKKSELYVVSFSPSLLPTRVGIPPFTCARKALEPLKDEQSVRSSDGGSPPDLLQLCHDVPLEVVHLKDGITGEMKPAVEPVSKDHYRQFIEVWLRCYENPAMNNLRDHNGRTIWFKVGPTPADTLSPWVITSDQSANSWRE